MGKFIKRLFDLLLALILIVPGFLVLLCGMLFVKIVSPESSPIFKQTRVGFKNKLFTMYKLRSMTNEHWSVAEALDEYDIPMDQRDEYEAQIEECFVD